MTPTYEQTDPFRDDLRKLSEDERQRLKSAVAKIVEDLRRGGKGLRVKHVQSTSGVWEMTWAPNGRATFEYGPQVHQGEPHVIWRRVGSHSILNRP